MKIWININWIFWETENNRSSPVKKRWVSILLFTFSHENKADTPSLSSSNSAEDFYTFWTESEVDEGWSTTSVRTWGWTWFQLHYKRMASNIWWWWFDSFLPMNPAGFESSYCLGMGHVLSAREQQTECPWGQIPQDVSTLRILPPGVQESLEKTVLNGHKHHTYASSVCSLPMNSCNTVSETGKSKDRSAGQMQPEAHGPVRKVDEIWPPALLAGQKCSQNIYICMFVEVQFPFLLLMVSSFSVSCVRPVSVPAVSLWVFLHAVLFLPFISEIQEASAAWPALEKHSSPPAWGIPTLTYAGVIY